MTTDLTDKPTNQATAILAYIPVLHQGYLQFFAKHPEAKIIYLVEESLLHDFRPLVKDIRALHTSMMIKAIRSLEIFEEVKLVRKDDITELNSSAHTFIIPDENEMHQIVEEYLPDIHAEFDTIFLRWDKKRSESRAEVQPDMIISNESFDQELMEKLLHNTQHSSDWWRQVASALVIEGEAKIFALNEHVPHDMQAYSDGDPRANYQSGEQIELSTSTHSESNVIARAAKAGIKTDGASLYCTTFPCQVCAKLIAESGIKKIYYTEGYSQLDGETVLKSKGVEIIRVER